MIVVAPSFKLRDNGFETCDMNFARFFCTKQNKHAQWRGRVPPPLNLWFQKSLIL